MDSKLILRRRLTVALIVAVCSTLTIFVFHEWYHQSFLPSIGISSAVGDSFGNLFIVMVAFCCQYLVSLAIYRDSQFGMETAQKEAADRSETFIIAAEQVAVELRSVKDFNDVVRAQLTGVVAATEKAVFAIADSLQGIDDVVARFSTYVDSTTLESEKLLPAPDDRNEHHLEAMGIIADNTLKLTEMFMSALASVQFQDVTRQQIEQVIDALNRLDTHSAMLANRLEQFEDPHFHVEPLSTHLDQMYSNYVMDSQREVHNTASSTTGSSAATGGSGPKIELF